MNDQPTSKTRKVLKIGLWIVIAFAVVNGAMYIFGLK